MVKHEFSFLETGSKTAKEFAEDFFHKKPVNYTTSDIRKIYCDKCNMLNCDKCFIHDGLKEIYKIHPFA